MVDQALENLNPDQFIMDNNGITFSSLSIEDDSKLEPNPFSFEVRVSIPGFDCLSEALFSVSLGFVECVVQ